MRWARPWTAACQYSLRVAAVGEFYEAEAAGAASEMVEGDVHIFHFAETLKQGLDLVWAAQRVLSNHDDGG